jgi:hypothetical protein
LAGLVLDDVLWAIREIRRDFRLRKPNFGLEQIERESTAKKALKEIIEATKRRHGLEICSKQHPLLEELGPEIYAEEIKDSVFSGYWRLSPSHVDPALRRIFEIALQTLAQLPARHPKVPRTKDKLVSLASRFDKLAAQADTAFRANRRIEVFFGAAAERDLAQLRGLPSELRQGAEMLKAIVSGTRKVKVSMDSPNPQVSFALYLVGWIEACTGRKYYRSLGALAATAFAAANMRHEPQWVHRLEIEMHRKMKKRRSWYKGISTSS